MQTYYELIRPFVLELFRVAAIAVVPVAIVALESGEVDAKALAIVAAVAVLKAIDRMLHDSGIATKGLVRF